MAQKSFDTRIKGESQDIFAEEYNKFIKTSEIVGNGTDNLAKPIQGLNTEKQIIFLRNDSGEDIDQYRALSLSDLVFLPQENEEGFKFRFSFKGKQYDQTDPVLQDPLNFCITQQSIAPDGIGRAMINGTTQARIFLNNINHRYVRLDDESVILQSAITGDARIQFHEGVEGEGWAVVQMAVSDSQRVLITNNSGELIVDKSAIMIESLGDTPNHFNVVKPDRNNALNTIALVGGDLKSGASRWQNHEPLMIFNATKPETGSIEAGDFIGTKENDFNLVKEGFGFLVLGVTENPPFPTVVICQFNGMSPALIATSDEAAEKINVKTVNQDGTGEGDEFELDVLQEAP